MSESTERNGMDAAAEQGGAGLRRRMIEEMQLRRFSERTIESYVRAVGQLAGWCWKSPDQVGDEELRGYFLYLRNQKRLARATTTIALCGIKFFFESTLNRDWTAMAIPRPRAEHKLPAVLSREEVRAILREVRELRHRACLTLIYSCGLRLGEGCRLAVADIDSARGLIHVREAKGNKDRLVPLPPRTLELLRECWKSHRNPRWIFPRVGRGGTQAAGSEEPVWPLVEEAAVFVGSAVFRARQYLPIVAHGPLQPDIEVS